MATVEFTSTVLGDEVALAINPNSRVTFWETAASNITIGMALKAKTTGTGVVPYTYVGAPTATERPIGIATASALSSSTVLIASSGMLPASIHGLAAQNPPAYAIVTTTGALAIDATPLATDWIVGIVDEQARLVLIQPVLGNDASILGAANTVYCVNAGATAHVWQKITTSNISATAAIVGTQLSATANIAGTQLAAAAAIAATQLAAGGAGNVLLGGVSNSWGKVTTSQIDAAAGIVGTQLDAAAALAGTQLAPSAADTVLQTNGAGTANEWAKIADANVDAAAAIATSKLALSPAAGNVGGDAYASATGVVSYSKGTKHGQQRRWSALNGLWEADSGDNRGIMTWRPADGATPGTASGMAFTSTALAVSSPALASTSLQTNYRATQFRSDVAANAVGGWLTGHTVAWRGNAAGLGGFYFWARFSMATATAATRCFIGLTSLATNICAANPGVAADTIGVGYDDNDAVWQVFHADGGIAIQVPLSETLNATNVYELRMYASPNGSGIHVQLLNLTAGTTLVDADYTTNIPTNTVFMYAQAQCGCAGTGVSQDFLLYGMRIETPS